MADLVMISEGKPLPHKTVSDWLCGVWGLRQSTQTARGDSFQLRQASNTLRNEARIKTEYHKYHNDLRLNDRVSEVGRWREILRRAQGCIELERKALDEEKEKCEAMVEKIFANLGVVAEVNSIMDKRRENDLVLHDALRELKNESTLLESERDLLTERCHAAFDEHNRLQEVHCTLGRTIEDQEEAIHLDTENITQTRHSSNIMFKPDPFEELPNTISYEAWLDHMRCSRARADNQSASATKLREAMAIARARADNAMRTQKNLTEFALRKCAYDMQRAKNELEWQKVKLKEDLCRLRQEIHDLDCAMKDKEPPQHLAETRLETRKYRPNCEFVKDEAMRGLCEEVRQVQLTRTELHNQLNRAKSTYNAMEDLLVTLDRDLDGKIFALTAILHALDTHQRVGCVDEIPANPSTARNLTLTNYSKEIPECTSGPLQKYRKDYEPYPGKCGIRQSLTC